MRPPVIAAFQARMRDAAGRLGGALGLSIVALIFLQATAAFLGVAVYFAFADRLTPMESALATAGVMLASTLVLVFVALLIARGRGKTDTVHAPRPQPAAAANGAQQPLQGDASAAALAEATRLAEKHPLAAVLATGLVGVLLGLDPKLRDDVIRMIK